MTYLLPIVRFFSILSVYGWARDAATQAARSKNVERTRGVHGDLGIYGARPKMRGCI